MRGTRKGFAEIEDNCVPGIMLFQYPVEMRVTQFFEIGLKTLFPECVKENAVRSSRLADLGRIPRMINIIYYKNPQQKALLRN